MSKTESKSTAKNLIAGGTAGAIEATIMFPTEFVKTQLQLYPGKYKGPIQCGIQTVKERGFFSLYRGLSTLVVGSIPKAAVRFAAYNQFQQMLRDKNTGKLTATKSMLAGLGAGISEAIIAVTPMETVKTMLIHDANQPKPRYRGLVHGVGLIIKEEGIRGIYKGVVPTMLKQGGNQAVRFTVYNFVKNWMRRGDEKKDLAAWQSMVCGAVAGGTSVYATMPFDVVKTKMQGLNAKQYKGTIDCFIQTVKKDTIFGLWKGTTPRLGRVCCSSSIIFASYEQVMKVLNIFWKTD